MFIESTLQWLKPIKFMDYLSNCLLSYESIQLLQYLFWYATYLFLYSNDSLIPDFNEKIGCQYLKYTHSIELHQDKILTVKE